MTRYLAFIVHLTGSACILSCVFLLIKFIWFPGALFDIAAGKELIILLMAVDVILGPMVTLIIFDPRKKKLKQDMYVILLCQISFMLFGLWSTFSARPVYLAFVEDRFYLVKANEIDIKDLKQAKLDQFKSLPLLQPELVGTNPPLDKKKQQDILFAGLMGLGLQNLPEYYVDYQSQRLKVLGVAQPAEQMTKIPTEERQRLLSFSKSKKNVVFVKLSNTKKFAFLALDQYSGALIAIL